MRLSDADHDAMDKYLNALLEAYKSGKIELFEAARVNRGGDEVAGDYILVDQKSDFFTVTPGKGTGGRVRAILQPKPPEK